MDIAVAIDCMGGDHGPHVTVPAALEMQRGHGDVAIILVGQREALEAELAKRGAAAGPRLRLQHASEVVSMDEPPAQAPHVGLDTLDETVERPSIAVARPQRQGGEIIHDTSLRPEQPAHQTAAFGSPRRNGGR